jgi:hypothetical protein
MPRDENKFTKDRLGKGIPKGTWIETVFHTGQETTCALHSHRADAAFFAH